MDGKFGNRLQEVSKERDLGVIMSEDLKWENSVLRQLSKVIKYLE